MGTSKKQQHSKQKSTQQNQSSSRKVRKWILRTLLGMALFILAISISFRLSPWPGALVIRWFFDHNTSVGELRRSLQTHAPKSGITVIRDQQYKPDDKDAWLDVYMPESAAQTDQKLPVVIWTHGGAWLSGSKADAAPYFQLLAQAGFTVIAPDYSLAPEKTYPTPIHQLNTMYAYVQENADRFRADTSQIILAGDSAGSQLSAQMAALITNPAYAAQVGITPQLKPQQLKGVILNCGIYKMEQLAHPNPNVSKVLGWGDDVTVWAYSGTSNFSDPVIREMSPYYHATKDFPPAFITGGNADPLTDAQSKPFADALQSLGVPVTSLFYAPNHTPALPHEYQFNLDNADGMKAFQQIVEFLHKNTHSEAPG